VLRTARATAGSAPFYAFISTTAVYQAWNTRDWTSRPLPGPARQTRTGTRPTSGNCPFTKRGCELAVEQAYGPGACLIARAGSIVGPHDNLGQLPWWLTRIAAGGRVIAPGDPPAACSSSTRVTSRIRAGPGRGTGRRHPQRRPGRAEHHDGPADRQLREGDRFRCHPVWMDEDFLLSHGVQPWAEAPAMDPGHAGHHRILGPCPAPPRKAAGLRPPPVRRLGPGHLGVAAVRAARSRPAPSTPPFGLASGKEQQVLAVWDSQPLRAADPPRFVMPGPKSEDRRPGPGSQRATGMCLHVDRREFGGGDRPPLARTLGRARLTAASLRVVEQLQALRGAPTGVLRTKARPTTSRQPEVAGQQPGGDAERSAYRLLRTVWTTAPALAVRARPVRRTAPEPGRHGHITDGGSPESRLELRTRWSAGGDSGGASRVGPPGEVPCSSWVNVGLFRAASLRTRRAPFNAPGSPAIYAACAAGFAWIWSWQAAQTMSVLRRILAMRAAHAGCPGPGSRAS